jgi:putative exosortase-associated protein (TIGR04073 family)
MRNRVFLLVFAAMFLISLSSTSWAGTFEDEQVVHYRLHKFSRGVVNVASSPFEVPNQMIKRAKEQDTAAGQMAGYVTGVFTGVGWAVWRCTSGIVDICSVPFCGNTKGLVQPEFITDEEPVEW